MFVEIKKFYSRAPNQKGSFHLIYKGINRVVSIVKYFSHKSIILPMFATSTIALPLTDNFSSAYILRKEVMLFVGMQDNKTAGY
jgi:hypothetical protein